MWRRELEGEDGLDARGTAGDAGDRPGRGDGEDRGVPHLAALEDRLGDVGEAAPRPGQLARGRGLGLRPEKARPACRRRPGPGSSRSGGFIRMSRSAQPMTPRPIRRLPLDIGLDLRQGVVVDVDDVVQEADGHGDDPGEAVPVEEVAGARGEEVGHVDRAQVAGLVGMEGLLAAGIGGLDRPQAAGRVGLVDPVDEDEPRVADGPGRFDDHPEDLAGVLAVDDLLPDRDRRCRRTSPS